MNALPLAFVKTYWILFELLSFPCHGLLAFHHIPTYSCRGPGNEWIIVVGAEPLANPTG